MDCWLVPNSSSQPHSCSYGLNMNKSSQPEFKILWKAYSERKWGCFESMLIVSRMKSSHIHTYIQYIQTQVCVGGAYAFVRVCDVLGLICFSICVLGNVIAAWIMLKAMFYHWKNCYAVAQSTGLSQHIQCRVWVIKITSFFCSLFFFSV